MEIDYLLFLQNIRESWGAFLAPFMDFLTKLSVSFFPILLACLVYWVFDRKAGKLIFGGFAGGRLINGFLKLTCCIYRPWILDSRVVPFGDSMTAATGYSFPSGHSTMATTMYGGVGMWFRKIAKWVTALLFFLVALTMLSRNFMGVHTPKDVLVGCGASIIVMFIVCRIERWTDANPNRDKVVMIVGILLCVALVIYYNFKPYPMDYLPDGTLLVDPAKMLADSYEGIGAVSAFVICRYFERRHFDFEAKMTSWKNRFIVAVIALIPLYFWYTYSVDILQNLFGRDAAKFTCDFLMMGYIMILVPFIMCRISKITDENPLVKSK